MLKIKNGIAPEETDKRTDEQKKIDKLVVDNEILAAENALLKQQIDDLMAENYKLKNTVETLALIVKNSKKQKIGLLISRDKSKKR